MCQEPKTQYKQNQVLAFKESSRIKIETDRKKISHLNQLEVVGKIVLENLW